jgi:hypothetical protein
MHSFSQCPGRWAILKLAPDAAVPGWALAAGGFVTISRTPTELSIICPAAAVPGEVEATRDWALLQVHGPFPFSDVGVLVSLAAPLAAAGIPIMAVSTYDTDYLLVREAAVRAAREALVRAGHRDVTPESDGHP